MPPAGVGAGEGWAVSPFCDGVGVGAQKVGGPQHPSQASCDAHFSDTGLWMHIAASSPAVAATTEMKEKKRTEMREHDQHREREVCVAAVVDESEQKELGGANDETNGMHRWLEEMRQTHILPLGVDVPIGRGWAWLGMEACAEYDPHLHCR